jgi:hypothetical protein
MNGAPMDSGDFRVTQIGDIEGALAFLEVPIIKFCFNAIFVNIFDSSANAKMRLEPVQNPGGEPQLNAGIAMGLGILGEHALVSKTTQNCD